MRRAVFMIFILCLPYCLFAQNNNRAKEILDKVIETMTQKSGIQIDFDGTEKGTIILKGDKFYLHSGHIQSWYDGNTQWSYIADTEEVNISNPTQDELQSINPYFILANYQENFECHYNGQKKSEGKQVHEITLLPKGNENYDRITFGISGQYYPIYVKVEQNGQVISEIHIKSYLKQHQINDQVFRFNKSLYPNAEIIDLR